MSETMFDIVYAGYQIEDVCMRGKKKVYISNSDNNFQVIVGNADWLENALTHRP